MGYDLYKVKNGEVVDIDWSNIKRGEYFRESVWGWKPLWQFICLCVGSGILTEEDEKQGWYNSCHYIDGAKALKLADVLKEIIKDRSHIDYVNKRNERLDDLPLEDCDHCNATGIRNDEHVQGTCNGCDGKGKKKSFETYYRLDVESIEQFEDFCRHSGGFEIH